MSRLAIGVLALAALSCASPPATPEARAIGALAREVRAWPGKNKCYSCHNNGDAARALFEARRRGLPFDPGSLDATTRWLERPEAWKDNGPDEEFNDRKLAALQFAFALATAVETGVLERGEPLARAADLLQPLQDPDGSFTVVADGLPGSPITYGRVLTTVAARRVQAGAGGRFAGAVAKADHWLRRRKPEGVLEASALLVGIPGPFEQRPQCLDILRRGQTPDGGWGPYATSPPEVFDTALALLALSGLKGEPGVPDMIRKGRGFLLEAQLDDGTWQGTTRPPGVQSYAHRISTSAWATLALLSTSSKLP